MTDSKGGCVGFFGLLGVAFIVLKLTGYVDWSWWLVTLPLWGGAVFAAVFMLLFVAAAVVLSRSTRRFR